MQKGRAANAARFFLSRRDRPYMENGFFASLRMTGVSNSSCHSEGQRPEESVTPYIYGFSSAFLGRGKIF